VELVHKLYLKSRGKLRVRCIPHTCFRYFIELQGQYSLHVFNVQRAEQDDGVLECNCIVQGGWFYTRFTQMQCRIVLMCTSY